MFNCRGRHIKPATRVCYPSIPSQESRRLGHAGHETGAAHIIPKYPLRFGRRFSECNHIYIISHKSVHYSQSGLCPSLSARATRSEAREGWVQTGGGHEPRATHTRSQVSVAPVTLSYSCQATVHHERIPTVMACVPCSCCRS